MATGMKNAKAKDINIEKLTASDFKKQLLSIDRKNWADIYMSDRK